MAVLIDSGGDNDAISVAGSQARNWIDLREGKFSTLRTTETGLIQNNENISIAFGSVIENAIGGDKNDTLIGNWSPNKLEGGSGNDSLFGDGDAKVNKLGADPTVTYTTANPTIDVKEADSDIIVGGAGLDNLYGGMGDDTLIGDGALTNSSDGGSDVIDGGDGIDIVDPFGNTDFVENVEVVIATDHADVVDLGQLGVSIIFDGGGGNDDLDGGAGNDSLFGGEGVDSVTGGAGDDLIGNIHAPTFDYISMTPAERQAVIDSEDDAMETTLSGAVAFEHLNTRIFEVITAQTTA